mmetsp:Transcript_16641/g.54621  ORF Transcript_16641/g.54621 Transcript_16641/m.54621 type:complete len:485 (+) Transcript_16641:1610-3064(+)
MSARSTGPRSTVRFSPSTPSRNRQIASRSSLPGGIVAVSASTWKGSKLSACITSARLVWVTPSFAQASRNPPCEILRHVCASSITNNRHRPPRVLAWRRSPPRTLVERRASGVTKTTATDASSAIARSGVSMRRSRNRRGLRRGLLCTAADGGSATGGGGSAVVEGKLSRRGGRSRAAGVAACMEVRRAVLCREHPAARRPVPFLLLQKLHHRSCSPGHATRQHHQQSCGEPSRQAEHRPQGKETTVVATSALDRRSVADAPPPPPPLSPPPPPPLSSPPSLSSSSSPSRRALSLRPSPRRTCRMRAGTRCPSTSTVGSIRFSYKQSMSSCACREASTASSRNGTATMQIGGSGSLARTAASAQAPRARAPAAQPERAGRRYMLDLPEPVGCRESTLPPRAKAARVCSCPRLRWCSERARHAAGTRPSAPSAAARWLRGASPLLSPPPPSPPTPQLPPSPSTSMVSPVGLSMPTGSLCGVVGAA